MEQDTEDFKKDYHYEWRITKIKDFDWGWEVFRVYPSGLQFRDGSGYTFTKWGAARQVNRHYEQRMSPPVIKERKVYEGRLG